MIKAEQHIVFFLLFSFIFELFSPLLWAASLTSPKAPFATTQPDESPAEPGFGADTGNYPSETAQPVKPADKTLPEKQTEKQTDKPTEKPTVPPRTEEPAPPSPIESSFLTSEIPGTPTRTLLQFGYHLFALPSMRPVLEAPVGPDYVLGPGDTLIINIWGMIEQNLKLPVDREGKIFLPKVGPLSLWGLTLEEAKILIEQQLSRYFTKFQLSISMGSLRTIKVFILGEALRPGAYDLSAVSTLSNALFAAGGPSKIGTLRHIQHIRKNQKIGEIDIYDLLLRGDKSHDARMESGDVIFIPSIGSAVGISGNVKRPAIYELTEKENLPDLIQMAGGITPLAYLQRVQIERIKEHREKILTDIDLTKTGEGTSLQAPLENGDLVKIFAIHERIRNVIFVEGFVRHPGEYSYQEGMKVSSLLTDEELLPEAYLNKAEVVRLRPDFSQEIIPFSIQKLKEGLAGEDIPLLARDRIVISSEFRTAPSITLKGEFFRPGSYAIAPGEKLSSIIRRAGGFTQNAYLPGAIFIRKKVAEGEQKELETFVKVQEEKLLSESSALTAGGVSQQDASAEQTSLNQRRELLKVLSSKVTLGRVVVRLNQPEKLEGTADDLLLEDRDNLTISTIPSSVVVLGSVRNATGILYKEKTNVGDYLAQAGGASEEANAKGIYLIKADGSATGDLSLRTPVDRGDTVIVPISTEAKYRPIPLWRDIATIIGQLAITLAAFKVVF
jgi:protein involved in polysaccharide export with SLBB domain